MERIEGEHGSGLWLLTDRELKSLYLATGCLEKKGFDNDTKYMESNDITFEEVEELWNIIDDMLREGKPDEARN